MANPRIDVSIVGLAMKHASFLIDDSTITYSATEDGGSDKVDLAVSFSAANTVETVGDGEAVLGKLIKVEADGVCTVQTHGGMTLPGGDSASLTRGKKIVGALLAVTAAEGCIREVATATAAELGLCRGFICDASTATAIEVWL